MTAPNALFFWPRRGGKNKPVRDEIIRRLLDNPHLTMSFPDKHHTHHAVLSDVYKKLGKMGGQAQTAGNYDLAAVIRTARENVAAVDAACRKRLREAEAAQQNTADRDADMEFVLRATSSIWDKFEADRLVDEANFVSDDTLNSAQPN